MINDKLEIAVFGSAFNPPSLGHLSVIERLMRFDRVLLVPSISHAWGKEMLPFDVRCKLLNAFIDDIKQEKVQAFVGELELQRHLSREQGQELAKTRVTTFDLLSFLQTHYPDANLTFVLGPDNLLNFDKFYNYELILKRWQILMCPETLAVRSSSIRKKIARNESIDEYVSPTVKESIAQLQLFK